MAKELPYFKFEPAEWEAGNIQAVSRESKGLFIEICSLYWIRTGELPYALALQKLCNGNAELMQELKSLELIGVIEGQIIVEFLDEQLDEFQKTSEKRANAANKRWNDAKGMQVHSKSNAIREEKSKEDKKRKDNPLMSEANASDVSDKNKNYFDLGDAFFKLLKRNSEEVLKTKWTNLDKAKADTFIDPIRLLIESDNRTEEELRIVGNFLYEDDFWMPNIQSTKKLREKFDQLITKAKNNNHGKSANQRLTNFIKSNSPEWDKY